MEPDPNEEKPDLRNGHRRWFGALFLLVREGWGMGEGAGVAVPPRA